MLAKEQRTFFDPSPQPPLRHVNGPSLPPLLYTAPPLTVPSISPSSSSPGKGDKGQTGPGPTQTCQSAASFRWPQIPPYCLRGHDKEEGGPQRGMQLTGRQKRLKEGRKLKENPAFSDGGEQKPKDKAGRCHHGRRSSTATAYWPVWSTGRDSFQLPFFFESWTLWTLCVNSVDWTKPAYKTKPIHLPMKTAISSPASCFLHPGRTRRIFHLSTATAVAALIRLTCDAAEQALLLLQYGSRACASLWNTATWRQMFAFDLSVFSTVLLLCLASPNRTKLLRCSSFKKNKH